MLAAARTLRVALGHLSRSARFASCSEVANALPSAMPICGFAILSKFTNAHSAFSAFETGEEEEEDACGSVFRCFGGSVDR